MDAARYAEAPEEITVVRRSVPARGREPIRLEVSLDAVVKNLGDVKAQVGDSRGVLAVLKADAYGHGLVPVARALERHAAGLVVTSVRDGLALRHENISCPVVVMAPAYPSGFGEVFEARLVPVLTSIADLEGFGGAARARGTRADAHVKIDTGMSRLGLHEGEIGHFLGAAARHPHVTLSGLCTHLMSADTDALTTRRQLDAFERARERFHAAGHRPSVVHAANTAATFRHPRAHFSHVRTGIALFGGDEPSGARLRSAMRLVARVAQLRWVGQGERVSYGGAWQATRASRLALLPIGYAHGYPRRLEGRREVLVRGRRCPIVGAICMEMMLVDVTEVSVEVGEEIVLIGEDGGDEIRATDLAASTGGIVEEIFCGISKSIPREYPHVPTLKAVP